MKKATVTVSFEQEKLKAVQFYAGKNGTSLELELDMFMEKLYKKYVPSQTREYIESMAEPEEQPRPRPARNNGRFCIYRGVAGSAALGGAGGGAEGARQ